jgi:hypothetical protein
MNDDVRELVRIIALDRAHQIASKNGPGQTCGACGLPALRWACSGPFLYVCCAQCQPPGDWGNRANLEWYDHPQRAAIERLTKIARGER